jgi:hypothetical protein
MLSLTNWGEFLTGLGEPWNCCCSGVEISTGSSRNGDCWVGLAAGKAMHDGPASRECSPLEFREMSTVIVVSVVCSGTVVPGVLGRGNLVSCWCNRTLYWLV